jgi:uncharacterized membrane protein
MIKNFVVSFIGLFILNTLWHSVMFGGFYNEALKGVMNFVDGKPAPDLLYFILSMLVMSFAWAYFVPRVAKKTSEYVKSGLVMAFATTGTFALLSKGLFMVWTIELAWMDIGYSVFSGIILGLILAKINKKNSNSNTPQAAI